MFFAEKANNDGISRVGISTLERIADCDVSVIKKFLLKFKSLFIKVDVEGKIIYTTLFNSVCYDNDFVEVTFCVKILNLLMEADNFLFNVDGLEVLKLKRAALLYGYFSDNGFNSTYLDLESLKSLLNSNMSSYGLFKARDLTPALYEINDKMSFNVSIEEVKETGSKKVVGIKFNISKK